MHHHASKACWGSGGKCHVSELGGGEWEASRPGCFIFLERDTSNLQRGEMVRLRIGPGILEERET
jgi:hypothetical protein